MPTVPARKLVILVDDDPGFLKAVGRLLSAHGFDSQLFSCVRDFHSRAQLERASCLLLDIDLNGESGIELRRKITISGRATPVIFMTGNDSECVRQAAMEAGCVGFVRKPFVAQSLMDALEKACAESKLRLPPVTASSAPAAPPRPDDRLPRIFPFDHFQAALERARLREERAAAKCRAAEIIVESEELLREADEILSHHPCIDSLWTSVSQPNERSR